jgi:hypothetical protein
MSLMMVDKFLREKGMRDSRIPFANIYLQTPGQPYEPFLHMGLYSMEVCFAVLETYDGAVRIDPVNVR